MSIIAGMIIHSTIRSAVIGAERSSRLDEKARARLTRAFERECAARELSERKQTEADNSMIKLANRKRAILSTSIKDFVELYSKIQKINFVEGEGIKELDTQLKLKENVDCMLQTSLVTRSHVSITDEDVVKTYLVAAANTGNLIGGIISASFVMDSKKKMKEADLQMRAARVVESQALTLETALNGIIDRCDRFSDLLTKLNLLFVKSIRTSNELISEKLYDKSAYTSYDRKTLMTCMNLADTIYTIIGVPIFDNNGDITKQSYEALQTGNEFLKKIKNI